jgi:hypothetical protein
MQKILFILLTACGVVHAGQNIPAEIAAPNGNKAVLTLHAKGEQRYLCVANADLYAWQFQAPKAQLFNQQGQAIGLHSLGPVWLHEDGSRIVGKTMSQFQQQSIISIPWLLLEAVQHQGKGVFDKITFIQRINTQGGLPPLSTCNANHLGSEKGVPYTADYIFYQSTPN